MPRPDDYPIPAYAAYIWIAGDEIVVQFPPALLDDRSHTVKFPNTENGLLLLLDVMRRRRTELSIGLKGTPTKYEIERTLAGSEKYKVWLEELKRTRGVSEKEKAESIEFLKELGL